MLQRSGHGVSKDNIRNAGVIYKKNRNGYVIYEDVELDGVLSTDRGGGVSEC